MKKILALLLLVPSLAFAQGLALPGGGVPRLKLNDKLCFNYPTCSVYLTFQGSIVWEGASPATTWRLYQLQTTLPAAATNGSCDTSASPGNATCNDTWTGIGAVAAGASTVTITSNQTIATRKVLAVLRSNDAGCTSIKSVAPGAGSFVVTTNANCTGNVAFSWFLYQ